MKSVKKYIFLILLCSASLVMALEVRPTLFVPAKATVKSEKVLLKDIATIKSVVDDYKELVEQVSLLDLNISLRPRESRVIRGEQILSALTDKGIDLEVFGYSVPREITIQREGIVLSKEVVLDALKLRLQGDPNLDVQVNNVEWASEQVVPASPNQIEAEVLGAPVQGKLPVRVSAFIDSELVAKFLATAVVDDWKAVPILRGRLDKGTLIRADDVQVIRANISSLPADISFDSSELIGRRLTRAIPSGEPIRKADIDIPPMIEKGKVVSVIYNSGGFFAKATAVALQDGKEGDVIELKNDRSHKVLRASVVGREEVKVIQ